MIWIYVLCASKSYEMKIIVPSLLRSIRFGAYANNQNFLLHKNARGEKTDEKREKYSKTPLIDVFECVLLKNYFCEVFIRSF